MDNKIVKPEWNIIIQNLYSNALWLGIITLVGLVWKNYKEIFNLVSAIYLWIHNLNISFFMKIILDIVGILLLVIICASIVIMIRFFLKKILFIINKNINQKKVSPTTLEVKKLTFLDKQEEAITSISTLLNNAVNSSISFSQGVSYPNEPTLKEQCMNARNNGKQVMIYLENDNNRLYFPQEVCEDITKIYNLISKCTQKMSAVVDGNFDSELWHMCSEELNKIEPLRDKVFSKFHEILGEIYQNRTSQSQ